MIPPIAAVLRAGVLSLLCLLAACASGGQLPNRDFVHPLEVIDGNGMDVPPVMLSGKTPVFPITELIADAEGYAVVDFTVGEDGRARDFAVVEASKQVYADHLVIAIRDWRFQPAMRDGTPIAVRVREGIRYSTPF